MNEEIINQLKNNALELFKENQQLKNTIELQKSIVDKYMKLTSGDWMKNAEKNHATLQESLIAINEENQKLRAALEECKSQRDHFFHILKPTREAQLESMDKEIEEILK